MWRRGVSGLPVYGPVDELRPGPTEARDAVEAVRLACPALVEALGGAAPAG